MLTKMYIVSVKVNDEYEVFGFENKEDKEEFIREIREKNIDFIETVDKVEVLE